MINVTNCGGIYFLHMKGKFSSLLKGSFFLGLGAFGAKVIGALYRIFLTRFIGGYGIGLYQMVFPIYTVLLDFSGAGVPSALSKLIASSNGGDNESYSYLRLSKRLFFIFGLASGLLMATLSGIVSKAQGDANAFYSYITLAPAVLFVCLISSYRGYFQGKMNMIPTAISQIVEQGVKLIFGLIFCQILLPNIPLAVAGATLAITISEIIAFLYLYVTFKLKNKGVRFGVEESKYFSGTKTLLRLVIPITLIGITLPLSQVFDSFITINILSRYTDYATTLYGLFSGVVLTIIHLPVSICYGISASVIPVVSGARSKEEKWQSVKKSVVITILLSVVATVFCVVFAPQVLRILFGNLMEWELELCIKLLRLSAVSIVFHTLLQTVNGVLIGEGRIYPALLGMVLGVITKIIVSIVLVSNPQINIYGSAISSIACYFTAFLVNSIIVIKRVYVNANKNTLTSRQVNIQ